MSQVLSPHKQGVSEADALDYTNSSSIIEFLAKEQDCGGILNDPDPESIFQEVSRLSDSTDMRSVDELLQEAERLIQQQLRLGGIVPKLDASGPPAPTKTLGEEAATGGDGSSSSPQSSPHSSIRLNTRYTHRIEHSPAPLAPKTVAVNGRVRPRSGSKSSASPTSVQTPLESSNGCGFAAFVDNLPSASVISEESTPKDMDMENHTAAMAKLQLQQLQDNTDDDEDTVSFKIRLAGLYSTYSYWLVFGHVLLTARMNFELVFHQIYTFFFEIFPQFMVKPRCVLLIAGTFSGNCCGISQL